MTTEQLALIAGPVSVIVGMMFTAYWTSRKRNEDNVAANVKRDAVDASLTSEIKNMADSTSLADKHLAEGLAALSSRFDAAITEFKVSNDRNAKHELDCAEFRGATVAALKELASSSIQSNSFKERLAVHDEQIHKIEESIEWSSRRFEELFRGQAALARGVAPAASLEDEPSPPSRRAITRRTKK